MRQRRNVVPPPPATEPPPETAPQPRGRRWEYVLSTIVLGGAAAIPLVISYDGYDHFRLPKELLLYAVTIVTIAVAGVGLVLRHLEIGDAERRKLRAIGIVVAAGVAWMLVSLAASRNRTLSIEAAIWVLALVFFFLLAARAANRVPLPLVAAALLLPALVNAVIVMLQALKIWNPWVFPPDTPQRLMKNALLGNPDDVAVYLITPALFAFAAAFTAARARFVYAAAGVMLLAGVLATETLSAILAFACGIGVLLVRRMTRVRSRITISVVAAVVIVLMLAYAPTRLRLAEIGTSLQRGEWGHVARGRIVPLAAAWQMFADNPLAGVGPGCFKFEYMPYRVRVEHEHPRLAMVAPTEKVNFGEAHNDHAQILAETGLPGFLAALAALVLLARISLARPREDEDERGRLARTLALPFAVMVAAVMIPQFPWHIAAPSTANVLVAACCFIWRSDDAV
ncbi:MAG TPA: O-antigen ligase family protein [Thermoanaerobaculia bacterium]|nr:O-antigen ligase family protein [Thermoanaerobaculia bacterium]